MKAVFQGLNLLCILVILNAVLLSGCEMPLGPNVGRLDVRINGLELEQLDWEPGTDIEISRYTVSLRGPDGQEIEQEFSGDIRTFSFDNLVSGTWTVDIRGYNSEDELLVYLERNSSGERTVQVQVYRSFNGAVSARMISIQEGGGVLKVSVLWGSLGVDDAVITLDVVQLDGEQQREGVIRNEGEVLEFTDLPGGIYEITVILNDEDPDIPEYWRGIYYAYVYPGIDTEGTIEASDPEGSAGVVIGEPRHQAEVSFSWTRFPVIGESEVTFTSQGTFDNPEYRWYVNGVLEGTDAVLTYEFPQAGNYHVVLSVLEQSAESGFLLGNTSEVIAVLEELPVVGGRGPAGGYVVYDKGEVSNGWRFLEAAEEDLRYPTHRTFPWSNITNSSIETLSGIGEGMKNTEAVIAQEGHETSAAWQSSIYEDGVYRDWYLPSRDELKRIYEVFHAHDIGGFVSGRYWSSSEFSSTAAWAIDFSNGQEHSAAKTTAYHLRVIRSF